MRRLLVLIAVAVSSATLASVASGVTSPWVTKANAVCASWGKKATAIFGATPAHPTTAKQRFEFAVKGRKVERGILADLRRIALPRPPGADKALALAAADIQELDTVIGLYGAVSNAEFTRDFLAWESDTRANRAFAAIGARRCA
jgi:hypothetical protein